MSFTVKFYTLAKRNNSTQQPTGGASYNIILKDSCDILNPVIQLQTGQSDNPTAFNYCYIAEFNRYYFCKWSWENRLWVAYCSVDPMASWKSYIGSYHGYVSRAASSYDTKIVDMYYPAKAQVTEIKNDVTTAPSFSTDVTAGCFVLGVMGKDNGQNGGAVTYYAVKPEAVASITNYLMDVQNVYPTATDISDELLKCIFNPMQYIVSCLWFPFDLVTGNDSMWVGWWNITMPANSCKKLSDMVYTRNLSYSVPKHPQAATRGNYLNLSPFSSYVINAGPWGVISVNGQHILDESTLTAIINVDLMTGSGRFSIKARDYLSYIEEHTAQIGVPVQLGQNMFNQGAITSTLGHIGSLASSFASGNITGALANGYSAIGDAASMSQSVPVTVGSNGSIAFNNLFNIIGRFLTVVDEDLTSRGRPLCKAVTLSTLSGYIMCEDADPAIPCTESELSTIVSYLNGGFYYE